MEWHSFVTQGNGPEQIRNGMEQPGREWARKGTDGKGRDQKRNAIEWNRFVTQRIGSAKKRDATDLLGVAMQ